MSKGETPTEPGASEATGGSSVVMPILLATGGTVSGPMSRINCANTTLIESWVAVHRSTLPPVPAPSALSTQCAWSCRSGLQNGKELELLCDGGTPCSNAAARMYGLND